MRPTIGIVMDWCARGSYSPRPHYVIRDSYFAAVWDAGGLLVGIPLLEGQGREFLDKVQGVIIPGGDYPSPSRWYGDGHGIADEHPRTVVNEQMIREMIARDIPFLAICAGHQELAAATGGLLYWRVQKSLSNVGEHRSGDPSKVCHPVRVEAGSLLHRLVGVGEIEVNSHHHEAVRSVGSGVKISGMAPDGVIEAIEVPACRFGLGVQWHPEFGLTEADHKIFSGLVEAARAAE